MGIKYKDYYHVLGLRHEATEDQVRQAYRSLARKYHPDFNLGDRGCEDKFKEINEAYEVLGDSEKRKRYDQIGPAWNGGKGVSSGSGWDRPSRGTRDFDSGGGRGRFSEFCRA